MHFLPKITAACLAGAALIAMPQAGAAQDRNPNQLKAAIIYNIIRFIDFGPGNANKPLELCVHSGASGQRALAQLDGKRAGTRHISYRLFSGNSSRNCDVVYLGVASASQIAAVSKPGALVIGDSSRFVGAGGTIGLVKMGGQIRFEVNTRQARKADLSISSKLLRLAARIQK